MQAAFSLPHLLFELMEYLYTNVTLNDGSIPWRPTLVILIMDNTSKIHFELN
jgi:hypothetical protein